MINIKNIFSIYDYFYYNKVNSCTANDYKDKDCKCWHKEGTGPRYDKVAFEDLSYYPRKQSGYISGKVLDWKKKLNKKKVVFLTTFLIVACFILFFLS